MKASRRYGSDVLVIGAGLAGERLAVEVALAGYAVNLVTLVPPRRSHSAAAQGGMQASLGNSPLGKGDHPDLHFADTVRGADWGCDQPVVRQFVEKAPEAVRQMDFWGVPWARVTEADGNRGCIAGRKFGGTRKWRACYTADGTGHCLLYAVDSMVGKLRIPVFDRMEALSLIHGEGRCHGAVCRCLRTGEVTVFTAPVTVVATGGCGMLYEISTNAVVNWGGGLAIAVETGIVPLGNMEAVQFHPTALVPSGILITEGARGDGGVLRDRHLRRFMPDYAPEAGDLAFRDVVARSMVHHMRCGNAVDSPHGSHLWLDLRHLGKSCLERNLPEILSICRQFNGIDPLRDLIPVRPAQHYQMGGIRTDIHGAVYGMKGLFALGEAACWDLHGFNRLGGNSLAEAVVAGMVVGRHVVRSLKNGKETVPGHRIRDAAAVQRARIAELTARRGGEKAGILLRRLTAVMSGKAGIFRDGNGLRQATAQLTELYRRSYRLQVSPESPPVSPEIALALRLPGMIKLALCIVQGALNRTESRGSHYRIDHPERDDRRWLKRTLAYWPPGADGPVLRYEPVAVTELPPAPRAGRDAISGGTHLKQETPGADADI